MHLRPTSSRYLFFFFFNDTATTEIYTLSLHDALPIYSSPSPPSPSSARSALRPWPKRSEEHTSELQSHSDLVCRLLLEKKKIKTHNIPPPSTHKEITELIGKPESI